MEILSPEQQKELHDIEDNLSSDVRAMYYEDHPEEVNMLNPDADTTYTAEIEYVSERIIYELEKNEGTQIRYSDLINMTIEVIPSDGKFFRDLFQEIYFKIHFMYEGKKILLSYPMVITKHDGSLSTEDFAFQLIKV